jgi:hypothetical protein
MDAMRSIAEDLTAYLPARPDEERVDDPRFVVTFSPGAHFWSVSVGRLRLDPDRVDQVVTEVRGLVSARARDASVWTVGDSATPSDLTARLIDLGMEHEGTSDVLVLTHPPALPSTSALDVREVGSLEDLRAWIDVSAEAFGWPEEDVQDERARAEATFAAEREDAATSRFLAFDKGRPVAAGRTSFSPWGLHLGGGATLPSDRRRGAMTALLATAWGDAMRRGTPALVAHGGAMSTPVLVRLGFERIGEIVHLIDRP